MEVWWGVLLGIAVGLHVATWGAYKDAPFEGFHWSRFWRSVVLSVAVGVAVTGVVGVSGPESLIVLLGAVYCLERLATEFWKLFYRDHNAAAFTIPMRLGYRGRPIDSPSVRYAVGAVLTVGLALVVVVGSWVQAQLPPAPQVAAVLLAGVSGWLTALGGAWKDAPIEGFSGWKFLRSPAVATAWAVPLSVFSQHWALLALSAGGFAVASIETYKTFGVRHRPPGKFEGKPVRYRFAARREALAAIHAGLWALLAIGLLAGLVPAAAWWQAVSLLDPPTLARTGLAVLAGFGSALVVQQALLPRLVPSAR